jgi:hypothetical protein
VTRGRGARRRARSVQPVSRSKAAAIATLAALALSVAGVGAAPASAQWIAPTNLRVTPGVESLTLRWGVTSTEGLARFRVRWRPVAPLPLPWSSPVELRAGARRYTITGLGIRPYEVKVRAVMTAWRLGGQLIDMGTPLVQEEVVEEEPPTEEEPPPGEEPPLEEEPPPTEEEEEPPPSSSYYVSTAGSDSNPGTQAAPWRTIAHAASLAGAGSTVLIGGGSYPEDVKLQVSGAAGSPITFEANGSEAATVRSFNVAASHVAVENLTISGASGHCVSIQPALSDVTVKGNHINRCGTDGLHFVRPGDPPSSNYTTGSAIIGNTISAVGLSNRAGNDMTIYANYLAVQGNDMTGSPNDAVDMWGDHLTFRQNNIHDISNLFGLHNDAFQSWTGLNDGAEGNPVTNLLVEQNRVANLLGANAHGFMLEGPGHRNWTVRDNVFQNIGSIGMILGITGSGSSSQNLAVYNNTFCNAGPNDTVEFNSADTGLFVNNIVQGGGGVVIHSAATVTEDYNLLYGAPLIIGGGPHDVKASPGFVDALGGDFHLASNSPAIDTGDNGTIVSPVRAFDFDGNPVVGIVDKGAYEHL